MSTKKKTSPRPSSKTSALTARTADKHVLYQRAVQDPGIEVEFIASTFKKLRGRAPVSAREDFCGTALFCAEWVKSSRDRVATGVDIDPDVLAWGREHNIEPLGADAARVTLLEQDVRAAVDARFDVATAFNFSYWIFRDRATMRGYFEQVLSSLEADGVFLLDAYGGWEAQEPMLERRSKGNFTYVWDQSEINPIDNSIVNYIHFEFKDGTQLQRAFEYRWRFWSLPEICELLEEAGFTSVEVYWDVSKDEDRTLYRPRRKAENQPGWLAYIVACR